MKIYRFNPETGAYLGEDFADDGSVLHLDDATTIAPPEVDRGQMPIFHDREQRWEVQPNPRGIPGSERP